ncbi:sensor histidine kinase [Trinickia dinghuensis]|uniref:histidine kinase n=1 Tax=Trinickia dinghuensis TaxID=2291023 RepID=A0A3D8JRX4_9BURK|nr:sensor histidine kinase [Trinickia dinghuensis]RDU95485.1 sensor histidine kinase [Trinickia dinghuensis]
MHDKYAATITKAASTYRPVPLVANAVFVFSLVLLIIVGLFYSEVSSEQPPTASLHLTQADWQVEDTPGFSAPPSTLDSDSLPNEWRHVTLPLARSIALVHQARTTKATASHITWLRLSVSGLPSRADHLAIYGARIKTDGTIAVYVNDQLVFQAQEQGPLWNSTRTPLWVVMHRHPTDAPVKEILVRIEHTRGTQVAVSSLWLGPVAALKGRYHVRRWLQQELPAIFSAAFLLVGIFALFVWLQRSRETSYLLFFNLAVTSFLRSLHFYLDVPIANDWFAWLTVNSLLWLVLVVHFFLRQLHGRPVTWFTRSITAVTAGIGVLTLPMLAVLPNTPKVTPLIYPIAALMGASVGLVGGIISWRRSNEGVFVAIGVGVCTLLGVSDWLLQNNFVNPEGWYFGAYTNAITFGVFGVLMYRRYVRAIAEVEEANANLAQRLNEREVELELSHQRLREAERQQTISEERQRLMQDMHDGLGGSLISAIRSVEHGTLGHAEISHVLRSCLDDLKLTIDSMEPTESDLLLLLAALRFRLEPRLDGTGVALRWEVVKLPPLKWLDPSSALHVLRIVQESIANILRHTRASEIRVSTAELADGVRVIVEDNGHGFDVASALAAGKGHGLNNQRRRAQAINGSVDWVSGPRGTRFTLWLPLEREVRAV